MDTPESIHHAVRAVREALPGVLVVISAPEPADKLAVSFAAAQTFTALLRINGIAAEPVDGVQLIFTDQRPAGVWPDLGKCEEAARGRLVPLLTRGLVPVVSGGIGCSTRGQAVILEPDGSDLSATVLARSLRARSVTLFKEGAGLMTADPRWVPDARLIPELHYREASELGYYGATCLHPRTLIPLIEAKIPLFLKGTKGPAPGTRIAADVKPGAYPVKALTAFGEQALVSVEGNGMMGVPGMAARTFDALSHAGHSVAMISQASSESSICFVLPENEADHAKAALEEAFAVELEQQLIDSIEVRKKVALIAVVGLGMRGQPGIAARTFSALSQQKINVLAIAQGSSELNITATIHQKDVPAALKALHQQYRLDRIRPLPDRVGHESNLVLLGFGQIGRALADQMSSQSRYFRRDLGLNLKTIAVIDRTGMKLDERGYSPRRLKELIRVKASRKVASLPPLHNPARSLQLLQNRLWPLPLHQPVLVDLTAAETAPLLLEALEHGFHIVLANKKPLAVPQSEFDALLEAAASRGLSLRYEATVGAGLPVLDTLSKLKEAGDEVQMIQGCLSGTLGYLMTQLEQGVLFSAAVSKAFALGYTEPDPREDLSGMDVARKALILARTLGHRADLSDIAVDALFPPEISDSNPQRFLKKLTQLDGQYQERQRQAQKEKKVLRYLALISTDQITVGLQAVPSSSPPGRLHGTDNQVVVQTRRYAANPLVVTGPGAGAEVTAAGVLNDILAIASNQDRRPPPRSASTSRPPAVRSRQ